MQELFDRLYVPGEILDTEDAIRVLDAEPELCALNAHLRHKAANLRSVALDSSDSLDESDALGQTGQAP